MHYYSENQDSKLRLKKIFFVLEGERLEFITASGTFSINKVDRGSEVLIRYAEIGPNSRILDIGCGYGPIGISIAKMNPTCAVVMSEINLRATDLAKDNVKLNKIENVTVVHSNLYENVDGRFDYILSNPPQSAGKEVCYKIIEGAFERLNKKGVFYLVARKNKGGNILSIKMQEVFGNIDVAAKKSGYWVYFSKVD